MTAYGEMSPYSGSWDPALARELAAAWPAIRPRVLRYAKRCSRADADDLVQRAFVEIARRKRRWDRAAHPDLESFVKGVVRSLGTNARTSFAGRKEAGHVRDMDAYLPSASPDAEQLLIEREACESLRRDLRARLAGDALALRLLDLVDEGVTRPADQAEALGLPVHAIYDARERLDYAVKRLREARAKLERRRALVAAGGLLALLLAALFLWRFALGYDDRMAPSAPARDKAPHELQLEEPSRYVPPSLPVLPQQPRR